MSGQLAQCPFKCHSVVTVCQHMSKKLFCTLLLHGDKVLLAIIHVAQSIIVTILTTGARLHGPIFSKELTIKGFGIYYHLPRWPEAFKEMSQWIDKVYEVGTMKVSEQPMM